MAWWRLIAAVLLATCVAHVSAQGACPRGVTRPAVMTVVASPDAPETEALIVNSDCTSTRVELTSEGRLYFNQAIERVESIPSKTIYFECSECPLSSGFDLSAATGSVRGVEASATALVDSIFPRIVGSITIESTPIESLDTIVLPSTLQSLTVTQTKLKTVTKLPSTLTRLTLTDGQLTSIDFTVPPSLKILMLDSNPIAVVKQEHLPPVLEVFSCEKCKLTSIAGLSWPAKLAQLDVYANPITKLDTITLPPKLTSFGCGNGGLTLIRGVRLPRTLTTLRLDAAKGVEVEIQSSDVTVLEELISWAPSDSSVATNSCSDASATLTPTRPFNVCVISDERFNQLYPSSSSSIGSAASKPSDSSREKHVSGNSDAGSGLDSDGTTNDPTNGSGGSGASAATTSSTSSSAVTIIVVVASVIVAAVLAFVGFRLVSRRRREPQAGDKDYGALVNESQAMAVTADGSDPSSGAPSIEHWKRDIRWDPSLAPYRIDIHELEIHRPIARGGFGVVYTAEYNSQVVAIKRLAPDAWHDDAKVYGFMDEIYMCAMLKHPKIVTFIGIAWSSLKDISVVIEYMEGGDLYSQLHKQPVPASPQDWFQPWTATKASKSKALIACDVVEAVVYLHSFSPPILHRDLKARNVLLDKQGNAKLSDFGISRELSVDETMTSEVGTVAWIAPEVLRGDRYGEKADIYSLGVLLVELDRCRHPYAGGMAENGSTLGSISGTGLEFKDARIAMLVGAGQLRPTLTGSSPPRVKELVARCLQSVAEDRPGAAEVLEYLRQLA